MVVHLDEEQIAAYIDNTLQEKERQQVEQHLEGCVLCNQDVANVIGVLAEAELLAPATLDHPLESLFRPLERYGRLPAWLWNGLLAVASFMAWVWVLDLAHGQGWRSLILMPGLALLATQFIWLQPKLRRLVYGLWQGHAGDKELTRLNRRLSRLQGWRFGGLWLFMGLGLLMHLTNLPEQWSNSWDWFWQMVSGFYLTVVLGAIYWGWAWGGGLWHTLTDMIRMQPDLHNLPVVAQARRLSLNWVIVSSVGLAWSFLSQESQQFFSRIWEALAALALLILWTGYIRLEITLSRHERRSSSSMARVLLGLALVLIPMGLLLTLRT